MIWKEVGVTRGNDVSAGLPGRFARWQRENLPRWFPWVAFAFGVLYFTIRTITAVIAGDAIGAAYSAALLGFGLGFLPAKLVARKCRRRTGNAAQPPPP